MTKLQSGESAPCSALICRDGKENHRVERRLARTDGARCVLNCKCQTCGHQWAETYNLTVISQ